MKFPPASDIKRIRKSIDVTQMELASSSGISQSTIAKIERGTISASYDTVVRLFETLESMKADSRKEMTAGDVASEMWPPRRSYRSRAPHWSIRPRTS